MSTLKDLTGQVFGKLTVVARIENNRGKQARWECVCECGKTTSVLGQHLRKGATKSCGCGHPKGKSHKQWKGVGEISGEFWSSKIVRSANGSKRSNGRTLELSITKEYAWELFLAQNRKCALSGIDLYFPDKWKTNGNASLDRIDSGKGYIEGNVQWVHKDINMMKRTYTNEYFIKMCKTVAKNNAL